MFLNYDDGNNKIRQMTTDTTANCVEAEKEKERASTLSNNCLFIYYNNIIQNFSQCLTKSKTTFV